MCPQLQWKCKRQQSGHAATVGSAFLILAVWPVSAKIAQEIPYHCSHSNLLGAQRVLLCHMQSLENAIFPIPKCDWIGLSSIHDIQSFHVDLHLYGHQTASVSLWTGMQLTIPALKLFLLRVPVSFHCFAQTCTSFFALSSFCRQFYFAGAKY